MRFPSVRWRRGLPAVVALALACCPATVDAAQARSAPKRPPAERIPAAAAATPVRFEDMTKHAGIDFRLVCGTPDKRYVMDAMCGGVAAFDFDNDGWTDILLINGSTLSDLSARVCHPPQLYRNNHDGTFTNVSAHAGIDFCGWGMGVAIGDYDNDGWDDIYITSLQGGRLYRNNGNGTFTDVTGKAGVDDLGRWGASAAFADFDRDGHLDLYVANYVDLDLAHLPEFGSGPLCQYRGIPVSCGPRGLAGSGDRLYRNNGDGTFTDVSDKLGIDPDRYYGLGVVWADFNRDGCPDLYVADDSTPSLLYMNDCHGVFHEQGLAAGVAYSADGQPEAGMGVDVADYDHRGWLDIAKTNFSDDANNLYHNNGDGTFADVAGGSGFGPISIPYLAFGVKFFDFDNDGWPDIFVANGHVNPQVDAYKFGVTYAERSFLFHNQKDGKFDEVGLRAGPALAVRRVARGVAAADFDNDGRVDLLVTNLDSSPVLLRNVGCEGAGPGCREGHWIRIKTVGRRSNRDGIGARIEVTAGGLTQTDEVRANSGFESASDLRLHFGLGSATRIDSIVVRWPSGQVDRVNGEDANQDLTIEEGAGVSGRSRPAQRRGARATK